MVLPKNVKDNEKLKFFETESGDVAIRVGDASHFSDTVNLVSGHELTATYADVGSEIDMNGYNKLGLFIDADVNVSEDGDLKLLGKHTADGDEFEINGSSVTNLWVGAGTDFKTYYEFDISAIPLIQLHAKVTATSIVPAFLTGGTSAEPTFGTWAAVTDGSFNISIDGVSYDIEGVTFDGATSMTDVATVLQTAIRAATSSLETVTWSTNHFIISSVLESNTSSITVTSTVVDTEGTDISGAGIADWMDSDLTNGTVTSVANTSAELTIDTVKVY